MTATVNQIARVVGAVPPESGASREISGITHDSRSIAPGVLFCCVSGNTFDGHDYASEAVSEGAVALLCERPLDVAVPQIEVGSVRAAMGPAADCVHGEPSAQLEVIGVTGTNGKTTVVALLGTIAAGSGRRAATIGTLTGARTTPEAPELQARLAAEVNAGTDIVAMEVSSHALAQFRVDGTRFAVGVFTNLGRDHLDFHHDRQSYFEAKARLFAPDRIRTAVVCLDDDAGRELFGRCEAAGIDTVGYGIGDADDLRFDGLVSRFTIDGHPVELPLAGEHNVRNAIAAIRAAEAVGIPVAVAAAALGDARPPRGRFEPVPNAEGLRVVVDYAHTPDALVAALEAARRAADPTGSVTVVFGCGGDRDQGKRPEMGAVASSLADRIVITNDNPRSEDPAAIAAAVRSGVEPGADVVVELDRARAIDVAISQADSGDVVVIAGKGHETTQVVGADTVRFDDHDAAAQALSRRGASSPDPQGDHP